jgi:hypothetical protein
MVAREANEAARAAKAPAKFNDWIDEFYGESTHIAGFSADVTLAVEVYLAAAGLADDPATLAGSIVTDYTATSRELLLKAAECSADRLPESVAACVVAWPEQRTTITLGG